jgi:hypothetical protein
MGPSLSSFSASRTEQTCFVAPCPYCEKQLAVKFDPTLGGPTGGCINVPTCRCPSCQRFDFITSCCPFCQTPITMSITQMMMGWISLEHAESAPWCRLRLSDPQRDIGQPHLPSQLSPADQSNYAPQRNDYIEHLKKKGYLSAAECFTVQGKQWNGSAYWERRCPRCYMVTQIRFTPLPLAVTHGDLGEITIAEWDALDTFLMDHCGQPVEDFVSCPHCQTLLSIKLSFIEHGGGLYMSQWSVASSDTDQELQLLGSRPKPLEFGWSGVHFNQFAMAGATASGNTVWS